MPGLSSSHLPVVCMAAAWHCCQTHPSQLQQMQPLATPQPTTLIHCGDDARHTGATPLSCWPHQRSVTFAPRVAPGSCCYRCRISSHLNSGEMPQYISHKLPHSQLTRQQQADKPAASSCPAAAGQPAEKLTKIRLLRGSP